MSVVTYIYIYERYRFQRRIFCDSTMDSTGYCNYYFLNKISRDNEWTEPFDVK